MIKNIVEHKIQTELQANTHICQYGVASGSGDIVITFNHPFVSQPVVFVSPSIISSGASAAPVLYVESLQQDADNNYVGMTIYSDGTAGVINWAAVGVI